MIICFEFPHKVGSQCIWPCSQCHDDPDSTLFYLRIGDELIITPQPLHIVREAGRGEYLAYCAETLTPTKSRPADDGFYYEVSTD